MKRQIGIYRCGLNLAVMVIIISISLMARGGEALARRMADFCTPVLAEQQRNQDELALANMEAARFEHAHAQTLFDIVDSTPTGDFLTLLQQMGQPGDEMTFEFTLGEKANRERHIRVLKDDITGVEEALQREEASLSMVRPTTNHWAGQNSRHSIADSTSAVTTDRQNSLGIQRKNAMSALQVKLRDLHQQLVAAEAGEGEWPKYRSSRRFILPVDGSLAEVSTFIQELTASGGKVLQIHRLSRADLVRLNELYQAGIESAGGVGKKAHLFAVTSALCQPPGDGTPSPGFLPSDFMQINYKGQR